MTFREADVSLQVSDPYGSSDFTMGLNILVFNLSALLFHIGHIGPTWLFTDHLEQSGTRGLIRGSPV